MNWPLRLAQSVIPPGLHWFLGLKHSEIHGRARWMNAREEHAFLAPGHPGLVLGPGRRLSWDESFKNLVLMAPTGSGKTTRYVIPNLLQLQGSAVVTDPSGEIYRATSGHLESRRRLSGSAVAEVIMQAKIWCPLSFAYATTRCR